jgi:outer membrane protein assembly factor BamB
MARPRGGTLYVGIKGHVVALDRATGAEQWRTKLEGVRVRTTDFVYLHRDEDQLFAAYNGEVYALDPKTGEVRWHNQFRGLGTGLVSLLTDAATAVTLPPPPVFEEQRRRSASQHSSGA